MELGTPRVFGHLSIRAWLVHRRGTESGTHLVGKGVQFGFRLLAAPWSKREGYLEWRYVIG